MANEYILLWQVVLYYFFLMNQNITSPKSPHTSITSMGLLLRNLVKYNVAAKSAMLMAKLTALSVGDPKFSLFISSTAAAAISPTIVGRKPAKMSFTIFESLWLMR